MPRYVDPEERRIEIIDAAMRRLDHLGPKGVTIRGIAEEMGRSITAVTHYYPNRQAIIDDINLRLDKDWISELGEIKVAIKDPLERFYFLLDWLLPIDEDAKREEKIRLSLLAQDEVEFLDPARDHFSNEIETQLAVCLENIVPAEDVADMVTTLRMVIFGIILSTAEFPDEWTPERQRETLGVTTRLLGLPSASADQS